MTGDGRLESNKNAPAVNDAAQTKLQTESWDAMLGRFIIQRICNNTGYLCSLVLDSPADVGSKAVEGAVKAGTQVQGLGAFVGGGAKAERWGERPQK